MTPSAPAARDARRGPPPARAPRGRPLAVARAASGLDQRGRTHRRRPVRERAGAPPRVASWPRPVRRDTTVHPKRSGGCVSSQRRGCALNGCGAPRNAGSSMPRWHVTQRSARSEIRQPDLPQPAGIRSRTYGRSCRASAWKLRLGAPPLRARSRRRPADRRRRTRAPAPRTQRTRVSAASARWPAISLHAPRPGPRPTADHGTMRR